jgi:hypothetical protein
VWHGGGACTDGSRSYLARRLARHALAEGAAAGIFTAAERRLPFPLYVFPVASYLTSVPEPGACASHASGDLLQRLARDYAPCLCLCLVCRPRSNESLSGWLWRWRCPAHNWTEPPPPPSPSRHATIMIITIASRDLLTSPNLDHHFTPAAALYTSRRHRPYLPH